MTASPPGSSAFFVVQYRLRAGASREFSRLFGDLTDSLGTAGGFEGTEVHFDTAVTSPTVVWRFATVDEARTWSKSATMETFERSLEPYSVSAPVHNVIFNAGASALALEDRTGNFDVGKEADFVVLDPSAWDMYDQTLKNMHLSDDPTTARDAFLFAVIMLAREKALTGTYVRGRKLETSTSGA